MANDRLGRELKVGDRVCLRGRVVETDFEGGMIDVRPDVPFVFEPEMTLLLDPGQVRFIEDGDE